MMGLYKKGEVAGTMKTKLLFFSACLILFLGSGCVFEPYRPVAEFDLAVYEPVETAREVRVLEFRNDSTAGIHLQACEKNGRVIRDPYNSWALPPGQLVARALNLTLRPEKAEGKPVVVSGTLEVFEFNAGTQSFRLAGSWSSSEHNRSHRFDYSIPVEGNSAEVTASAASAAVRTLAEEIAGSMKP